MEAQGNMMSTGNAYNTMKCYFRVTGGKRLQTNNDLEWVENRSGYMATVEVMKGRRVCLEGH